jgi:hypothetical protein
MGHGASNKNSSAVISLDLAPWSRNVRERKLRKCAKNRLKVTVIEGGRLAVRRNSAYEKYGTQISSSYSGDYEDDFLGYCPV